ncbi:hypothetical protein HMPREF1522_1883 [Actinomyces sp. ICM54]|nr:hypothetical protein HMPREF1522_1883 [Actinomyces sp. ICM54]
MRPALPRRTAGRTTPLHNPHENETRLPFCRSDVRLINTSELSSSPFWSKEHP